MSARLAENSYGKHRVRVSKIRRARQADAGAERHEFVEAAVDVELRGGFDAAFTDGDNQRVIATDTCKNTVYALAKEHDLQNIESFALAIAQHFLTRYNHVNEVRVSIAQTVWERIGDCPHGFAARDRAQPTTTVLQRRGEQPSVRAGVRGLLIAKTTESGFENFHRDEFRTLADTDDRILATELTADWTYAAATPADAPFKEYRRAAMEALMASFLDHYSRSVQETLYRMGAATLEACDTVSHVSLTMPNKHHILANLVPEGTANDNEVFVVTDEPFGYIQGTVARE